MKTVELAMPVKGISWMGLIIGINEGEEKEFPMSSLNTVRPYISGRVKDKYPKRQYTTDTETRPGRFFVIRKEDLREENINE